MYKCLLYFIAIALPILTDGQVQPSCTSLQVEVETTSGNYQQVISDVIRRPVNATNLTMRCWCTNGSQIPLSWSPPSALTVFLCNNQNDGICIENQTKWEQIKFSTVKKEYEGKYGCYVDHSTLTLSFEFLVYG